AGVKNQNFIIAPSSGIENAQANIRKGQRYILYSHNFIEKFKQEAKTKYAAYCVFAHEIGHHVLNHNFSEKDVRLRKRAELSADSFAAIVLARLEVPRDDVLAGMQTLKTNIQSEYYPDHSARLEMLGINYDRERKRMIQKANGTLGENQTSIQLDLSCLNQWNLAKQVSAEITTEKVVVSFIIPPNYAGTLVDIVLCSPNPDFKIKTTTGIGVNVKVKGGLNSVTWNYQMDNVPKIIASKPSQLRIYVYSVINMPTAKLSGKTNLGIAMLTVSGAAAWGVGHFVMRKKALDDHAMYKLKTMLNDPFYTSQGTDRSGFYDTADKKFINAQLVEGAGIGLFVGGAIWYGIVKSKAVQSAKNAICYDAGPWKVEPMLLTGLAPGAGLRLYF
ncbi:MAG: hypothetical protein ABIQ93_13175, partial [Saprospiraceae bacterium]